MFEIVTLYPFQERVNFVHLTLNLVHFGSGHFNRYCVNFFTVIELNPKLQENMPLLQLLQLESNSHVYGNHI